MGTKLFRKFIHYFSLLLLLLGAFSPVLNAKVYADEPFLISITSRDGQHTETININPGETLYDHQSELSEYEQIEDGYNFAGWMNMSSDPKRIMDYREPLYHSIALQAVYDDTLVRIHIQSAHDFDQDGESEYDDFTFFVQPGSPWNDVVKEGTTVQHELVSQFGYHWEAHNGYNVPISNGLHIKSYSFSNDGTDIGNTNSNSEIYINYIDSQKYNITYDLIYMSGNTNHPNNPDSYWEGEGVAELFPPTIANDMEEFDGWKLGDEIVTSIPSTMTGPIILQAQIMRLCKFTYDYNGGTYDGEKKYVVEKMRNDATILEGINKPVKRGYALKGWKCYEEWGANSDGDVSNGQTVKDIALMQYSPEITIYAQWEKEEYEIQLANLEGASYDDEQNFSYTIDDAIELYKPSKSGYTFEGWYDNPEFEGDPVVEYPDGNTTATILAGERTGNQTFYAKWKRDYQNKPIRINTAINVSPTSMVYGKVLAYLNLSDFYDYPPEGKEYTDLPIIEFVEDGEFVDFNEISNPRVNHWVRDDASHPETLRSGSLHQLFMEYSEEREIYAVLANVPEVIPDEEKGKVFKLKTDMSDGLKQRLVWNDELDSIDLTFNLEYEEVDPAEVKVGVYAKINTDDDANFLVDLLPPITVTANHDENVYDDIQKMVIFPFDNGEPVTINSDMSHKITELNGFYDGNYTISLGGENYTKISSTAPYGNDQIIYGSSIMNNGNKYYLKSIDTVEGEGNPVNPLIADGFLSNITFTLEYARAVNINYEENGGSVPNIRNDEVLMNQPWTARQVSQEDRPSRDGYYFTGWNTQDDGLGTHYDEGQVVDDYPFNNQDLTLYAEWEPVNQTIQYYVDNELWKEFTVPYGSSYQILSQEESPPKEGYTLQNWLTEDLESPNYTPGSQIYVTGNIRFDSKWLPNPDTTYTVEHYVQNVDGTYPDEATYVELKWDETDKEVHADPQGWVYGDIGFKLDMEHSYDSLSGKKVLPNGSLVLKMYYKRSEHRVSFVESNIPPGRLPENEDYIYRYGQTVILEEIPEFFGYTFSNWTTEDLDIDNGKSFEMPDHDVTFIGEWQEAPLGISVSWNAGFIYEKDPYENLIRLGDSSGPQYRSHTQKVLDYEPISDDRILKLRTGYHLTGYDTDKDGDGTKITDEMTMLDLANITGDWVSTVYAQWDLNDYKVSYDLNYIDAPEVEDMEKVHWEDNGLLPVTPLERDHYEFLGWKLDPEDEDYVRPEDKYSDLVTNDGVESVTLYAMWKEDDYTTVTWNAGEHGSFEGGETEIVNEHCYIGDSTPSKPKVNEHEHYLFTGWEPEVDDTVTDEVTYTAQYKPVKYKVTYQPGEHGTFREQEYTIDYGEDTPIFVGETTGKPGYRFNDWDVVPSEKVTGNATYVAQWSAKVPQAVFIQYVDENGLTLASTMKVEGKFGDVKTVQAKEIDGYQLALGRPSSYSFTITEDQQEFRFIYTKSAITPVPEPETPVPALTPQPITIQYVDDKGNTIHSSLVIHGEIGDKVTVAAAEIDGYSINNGVTSKSFTISDKKQSFTFTYVERKLADTMGEEDETTDEEGEETPKVSTQSSSGSSSSTLPVTGELSGTSANGSSSNNLPTTGETQEMWILAIGTLLTSVGAVFYIKRKQEA